MIVDDDEAAELYCQMHGLDYENIDYDQLEQHIYDNYSCSLEEFAELIDRLLPMIDVGESPLTGTPYKGFSVPTETGKGSRWIIKQKIG